MYIAVNKIPGEAKGMVAAFKHALPDMKKFSGFRGLEIWESPDGSLQAISRWESKEALAEYTNNQTFREHHGGGSSNNGESAHRPGQVAYYECEIIS